MSSGSLSTVRVCLESWARWKQAHSGYTDMCSIGNAATSARAGDFASRVPKGVEPGWPTVVVIQGMEAAERAGLGQDMVVLRALYLRGYGRSLESVAADLGLSRRELYRRRDAGEAYLVGYLSAVMERAA